MISGIGIDIVELSRIRRIYLRQQKFVDRILTVNEKEIFYNLTEDRKTEYLAGRFAAKEAFSKAIGTGLGGSFFELRKQRFDRTSSNRNGENSSIWHTDDRQN